MRGKKLAALLLGAGLLLTLLTGCGQKEGRVRIGTGGAGGTYYAYGTVLSDVFSQVHQGPEYQVKTTAGSAANLRLISDGYLELAIAQSDVTDEAFRGFGMFRDDPRTGYSAVASLYTEACQIVVRADSDIRSVDDLLGRVVSVGEKESGVIYSAQAILECCGLSFDMVQTRNLSYTDAALALKNGEIDAFFCTAGAPTNAVLNLSREVPVRLLSLDENQMDRLLETYSFCIPATVPAGSYAGQEEDAVTVGVRALLIASDELEEELVYDLVSGLYDHSDAIQMGTSADTALVLEDAAEGITIPVHPGSAKFFAEHGVAVKEG